MLERTGVPTPEQIKEITPPEEILKSKPVAVIECFQRIPCDPCHTACPTGAILEFEDINDLPKIDWDKCTGCSLCVAKCPGLAIFVIDTTFSEDEALVKLPYEFVPVPEKEEEVECLNREGKIICKGRVKHVFEPFKDGTKVVSVAVPKNLAMEVRHIRVVR
ncbi:MAG: 4Fe-4S binding protein [Synergistetes bacterium]|nr:4Fe-4S binding protein [Synergistota bacterium]